MSLLSMTMGGLLALQTHAAILCPTDLFVDNTPTVALGGVRFTATLHTNWALSSSFSTEPVSSFAFQVTSGTSTLTSGSLTAIDPDTNSTITAWDLGELGYPLQLDSDTSKQSVRVELVVPPECEPADTEFEIFVMPAVLSLFPALVTLVMALVTRQVVFSLVCGVWMGCFFVAQYNPAAGLLRTFDTYLVDALADESHAAIFIFSLFLGGFIGILIKSGGAQGLANLVVRFAENSYKAQIAAWFIVLSIFFDDYANVMINGNSLRPITDKMRISREKLAFLVDAVAAPIAAIAPVSSWIGFELGLIVAAFEAIGLNKSAYVSFLEMIPQTYYPIYTLAFGFSLVVMGREFGPMYHAEVRARTTGEVSLKNADADAGANDAELTPKEGIPQRWYNALVPIGFVVLTVIVGLVGDGYYALKKEDFVEDVTVKNMFANADSFDVLIWASVMGLIVPSIMLKYQKLMGLRETLTVWIEGMKTLVEPLLILMLAWALGNVVQDLQLDSFVIQGLEDNIDVKYLPTLVFVLGAFISFSTGSAWATMAIMFPIVVPLAWDLGGKDENVLNASMASILSGAVFGDHCSPISDTTILSALACRCPVTDHVKTQIPYAVCCGMFSIIFGTLLHSAAGLTEAACIPIAIVCIVIFVRVVGKPVPTFSASTQMLDGVPSSSMMNAEEGSSYLTPLTSSTEMEEPSK